MGDRQEKSQKKVDIICNIEMKSFTFAPAFSSSCVGREKIKKTKNSSCELKISFYLCNSLKKRASSLTG
jgi:hypothetical protein